MLAVMAWKKQPRLVRERRPELPWPLEAQLFDVLPDVFLFVKDRASRCVRANRAFLVMHVTGGFFGPCARTIRRHRLRLFYMGLAKSLRRGIPRPDGASWTTLPSTTCPRCRPIAP